MELYQYRNIPSHFIQCSIHFGLYRTRETICSHIPPKLNNQNVGGNRYSFFCRSNLAESHKMENCSKLSVVVASATRISYEYSWASFGKFLSDKYVQKSKLSCVSFLLPKLDRAHYIKRNTRTVRVQSTYQFVISDIVSIWLHMILTKRHS